MFWLVLLLFVATTVISQLLAPKQQKPHAGALGDFQFPTAQEGRAIPVVFGTVKISGGNTVWWGDLKTKAITQRASIISFSSTIVGYKYYIGVQFCLCWGVVDELIQVNANEKSIAYTTTTILNGSGSEDRLVLNCNSPKLFGGTGVGGAGGFTGIMDFYRGLPTQQPNDYLSRVQGRIAWTPGTIPYTYHGTGNGTLTGITGGGASKVETITITATHIDSNPASPTYLKMEFAVHGSISGSIGTAFADNAFTSAQINLEPTTGSIAYVSGDEFTLETLHSSIAPAYKNICYAVMEQDYVGIQNSAYPIEFIVRRTPDPFSQGAGVANIAGDANGALAIYMLMTDGEQSLGILPALFDVSSFMAAAVTLADEGLGISVIIDTPDTADTVIGDILRHIDGIVYTDPQTGLWTIKLARFDYTPSALPVLDQSAIVDTPNYQRGSWSETFNSMILNYIDRDSDFNTRSVQQYDPANIQVTGETRSQTVDYNSLSNSVTAALVATRILRTFAYPLAKLKIQCNRLAYGYRVGGVFKWTWEPLGIENMIFRITHIGYGEVRDGKITIDAVEDIFGIAGTAFVAPPASGWVNPNSQPLAPAEQGLIEIPYHIQVQDAIPPGTYVGAIAARGDATSQTFQIWRGGVEAIAEAAFVPIGVLSADYPIGIPDDTTGFLIHSTIDVDGLTSGLAADLLAGNSLLMIDGEICSWQTIVDHLDGTYTISNIYRAVMDTVPAFHAAGAIVYFLTEALNATGSSPITDGASESDQFLPENPTGVYPIGSATTLTIATVTRWKRPYPPAALSVNGNNFWTPPASLTSLDCVMTWLERNRITQAATGKVLKQDDATVTPESGTTYTVKISCGGTLIRTVTGLTSPTYTYTSAQHVIDGGANPVLLQVYSNANSLDSLQHADVSLSMTP